LESAQGRTYRSKKVKKKKSKGLSKESGGVYEGEKVVYK
jgi:hypothetical protein